MFPEEEPQIATEEEITLAKKHGKKYTTTDDMITVTGYIYKERIYICNVDVVE